MDRQIEMTVLRQKELIHQSQWKILIILDACRYDYLEKEVKEGKLKKVLSPASCTEEWLKKTWTEKYPNIYYISANPFVSSFDLVNGWNASEHFDFIRRVWKDGWKKSVGTVPPKEVNRAALEAIEKYPDKRFVMHYMQPHAPYLTLNDRTKISFPTNLAFTEQLEKMPAGKLFSRLYPIVDSIFHRKQLLWKFARALGLPPLDPYDLAWRKVGEDGLRRLYKENLQEVLRAVFQFIKVLPSEKIIITSDHGEFLGERKGKWGHFRGSPRLRKVPWLEVE